MGRICRWRMESKSCKGAMLRRDFEPKLQAICCAFCRNFGCVSSTLSTRHVTEADCSYVTMVTFVKSLYVLAVTDSLLFDHGSSTTQKVVLLPHEECLMPSEIGQLLPSG